MEIHQTQKDILKELTFTDKLKFGQFKSKENIEQDKFNYHLQTLVKTGYLDKDKDLNYSLTQQGKATVQFMDVTDSMNSVHMPKMHIQGFILKDNKVLLSERLKHPFIHTKGFFSGKLNWGESTEERLIKECEEETGLTPTRFQLIAIRRCTDFPKDNDDGKALHDGVYFIYLITDFRGELQNTLESKNTWCNLSDLNLENILPVTKAILKEYVKSKKIAKFYETMITHLDSF